MIPYQADESERSSQSKPRESLAKAALILNSRLGCVWDAEKRERGEESGKEMPARFETQFTDLKVPVHVPQALR